MGGVENIYEATFNFSGILVMVDILTISNNEVSIYEVKSSTEVKDIYLHDVSIQYYVLKNLGFKIKSANVIHINNEYIRDDELDINQLFKIVDVTNDIVSLQSNIPNILKDFETYLKDKVNEPDIDIGKHCNNPYVCDAKEYCWKIQRQIPDYSIFNIFNLGSKKEWMNKQREDGISNEVYYAINRDSMAKKQNKADMAKQRHMPTAIDKTEYYAKNISTTGATEGAKMGLQQAVGSILVEFFAALFDEIIDIYKNGFYSNFEDERFLSALKGRLIKITKRLNDKWEDVATAFKDGFISGFLS